MSHKHHELGKPNLFTSTETARRKSESNFSRFLKELQKKTGKEYTPDEIANIREIYDRYIYNKLKE